MFQVFSGGFMPSFEKLTAEFECYLVSTNTLVEGAILIARQEYPKLSASPFQRELDQMAMEVTDRIPGQSSQAQKVAVLNHYFFEDLGFKGNRDRYYETANSYWPDVMERRTGIPISLAAIYLEVGWRLGFPLSGINFPGHFLVEWSEPQSTPAVSLYIDVFANGKILSPEDLSDLVRRFVGDGEALNPDFHLRRAEIRDILHRMLSNLKSIHAQAGHLERAILCADWMRLIKPDDLNSLRDKGMFLVSLDRHPEAEEALGAYLEGAAKAPDYSQVWQVLYSIRAQDPVHWN
jgi:regulator of sirC expression with transglutaminase-like and TPR domain